MIWVFHPYRWNGHGFSRVTITAASERPHNRRRRPRKEPRA